MDYTIEYRLRTDGPETPRHRVTVDITPPINPEAPDPIAESQRIFGVMKAGLDRLAVDFVSLRPVSPEWVQLVDVLKALKRPNITLVRPPSAV